MYTSFVTKAWNEKTVLYFYIKLDPVEVREGPCATPPPSSGRGNVFEYKRLTTRSCDNSCSSTFSLSLAVKSVRRGSAPPSFSSPPPDTGGKATAYGQAEHIGPVTGHCWCIQQEHTCIRFPRDVSANILHTLAEEHLQLSSRLEFRGKGRPNLKAITRRATKHFCHNGVRRLRAHTPASSSPVPCPAVSSGVR